MINKQQVKEAVDRLPFLLSGEYRKYCVCPDCMAMPELLTNARIILNAYLNGEIGDTKFEHNVLVPLSFYERCQNVDALEEEIARLRGALEKIKEDAVRRNGWAKDIATKALEDK